METSLKEAEALAIINPENMIDYIEKNGDIMRKITIDNMDKPADELAEAISRAVSETCNN